MNSNSEKKGSAYPLFALPECLRIAEAVRDLGGGRDGVPRSVLAQHLRMQESSSSFSQRMGAARAFKLVEGHGTYSLTDVARRYFYPTAENQKTLAALEMLATPLSFSLLLRREKSPLSGIALHLPEAATPERKEEF